MEHFFSHWLRRLLRCLFYLLVWLIDAICAWFIMCFADRIHVIVARNIVAEAHTELFYIIEATICFIGIFVLATALLHIYTSD